MDNLLIQQGWQCPICKRIYSPHTMMCYYCFGNCGFFEPKPTGVKNCPYCDEPADMDVAVAYTQIYCPRYFCDMPYMVVHRNKEEAIKAWNKLVEQIKQED